MDLHKSLILCAWKWKRVGQITKKNRINEYDFETQANHSRCLHNMKSQNKTSAYVSSAKNIHNVSQPKDLIFYTVNF